MLAAINDVAVRTATVTGGALQPADAAADARWVNAIELESLPMTEGLTETLTSWGVLDRRRH